MTSEQKKQVTDALVAFVLSATSSSHFIDRSEALALPAALDFLAKTDLSEKPLRISDKDVIIGVFPSIDLYGMVRKYSKSKE